MRIFCLALVLINLPIAARAAGTQFPFYAAYKSWLIGCDNTGRCTARAFALDGGPATDITLTRAAGPDGAVTAAIRGQDAFDALGLTLDSRPITLGAGWQRVSDDDGTSLTATGLGPVRALVNQIRNGAVLGLGKTMTIPLDGIAAALLRMDAAQGRVGTVTALLDPGDKPASAAPPALPEPVVAPHPVTATLAPGEDAKLIALAQTASAARVAKEECDAQPGEMTPEADALSDKTALVLLPCLMGAYQGSSLGVLVDRTQGTVSKLVLPMSFQGNPAPDDPTDMLTEPNFDAKTGTLSSFAKGRGLGDCGLTASWIWDGQAFQLAALNYQDACGGVEAGDWPALFRSHP
ncbi:DUF1176 domain-containing protein [Acidisoma cellulosilytica]|uniref:DUF1176 domain-containing protein n=1 Tax=Acidisoma cellulosilyticum TaxID=2802395 RepID=A0A963Z4N9_9PROT|nr:DUF1176 domain-containing protein [Acidisoma cellulosilyticum]MCB8881945.1 DUF1176 domain-containing protein [Acidisoma cellulosilyticum]